MNDWTTTDPVGLTVIFAGLFLGGVLKGATGAGLPVIAVPFIAAIYDVRLAVILLVIPNFFTNAWQIFKYRQENKDPILTRNFAIAGAIGAALGTALLATLPVALLNLSVALTVFFYITLRLARPSFHLTIETAKRWVMPVGIVAGTLQGALGLSSPVSISFLHAIKLGRKPFILTVSVFFATMSVIQVPVQFLLGLMTVELTLLSVLALLPILFGLPIGEWAGKKLSPAGFDRTILLLLATLAVKMAFDAITLLSA